MISVTEAIEAANLAISTLKKFAADRPDNGVADMAGDAADALAEFVNAVERDDDMRAALQPVPADQVNMTPELRAANAPTAPANTVSVAEAVSTPAKPAATVAKPASADKPADK